MSVKRYEVHYRTRYSQRAPTVRRFRTWDAMQEFVDKHRAIAYADAKRAARSKKLARKGRWVWFIQRTV